MTTDFVFEPPLPGSWTTADRDVANHEAAHAVAAVVLGLTVQEARIDRPDLGILGHVAHDKGNKAWWKLAVVSLAPLALSAMPPPEPDLMSDDGDVWHASLHYLDAGAPMKWADLIEMTRSILHAHRPALRALSWALIDHGALPGDEVRRIVTEAGTAPAERPV